MKKLIFTAILLSSLCSCSYFEDKKTVETPAIISTPTESTRPASLSAARPYVSEVPVVHVPTPAPAANPKLPFSYDENRFELLDDSYQDLKFASNGLALKQAPNNKYGFVNSDDVYIVEPAFTSATDFNEFGTALVNDGNNTYLINSRSQVVGEKYPVCIFESLPNGLFILHSWKDMYSANPYHHVEAIIDAEGNIAYDPQGRTFRLGSINKNSLILTVNGDSYAFDYETKKLITPKNTILNNGKSINLDLDAYFLGEHTYFISETNEYVTIINGEQIIAEYISEYGDYTAVSHEGGFRILSKTGKELLNIELADSNPYSMNRHISPGGDYDSELIVYIENSCYYIQDDSIYEFEYSLTYAACAENFWYLYNRDNKTLAKFNKDSYEITPMPFKEINGVHNSGFFYNNPSGQNYVADEHGNLIFNQHFSRASYLDGIYYLSYFDKEINAECQLKFRDRTIPMAEIPPCEVTLDELDTANYKENSLLYRLANDKKSVSFSLDGDRYMQNGEVQKNFDPLKDDLSIVTPSTDYGMRRYSTHINAYTPEIGISHYNMAVPSYKWTYDYEKRIFTKEPLELLPADYYEVDTNHYFKNYAIGFNLYEKIVELLGLNLHVDDEGWIISVSNYDYNPDAGELASTRELVNYIPQYYYPRLDGATSVTNVARLLYANHHKLSFSSSQYHIFLSRTHQAYVDLFNGHSDIIMVLQPSEEEKMLEKESDYEYEYIPFAREGFVFFTNALNPVDGLTTRQVKDIYQGKITNWETVGGNNEEIIAFQRNENSGSQTLMLQAFMKGEEMQEPSVYTLFMEMSGIVDQVAEYDNAGNAIGYSVQSYAADMYKNDNIKLLAIDGVEPTQENIASETYPYSVDYYLVFRKNEAQNSPVRKLVEFILSPEGQAIVLEGGLVPIGQN